MKKRILSLIIVMLLAFQMIIFQSVSGADNASYELYECSEAFLNALGIVGPENDYDETITRGMAASYIASMLNESGNFREYRGIFSDVEASNKDALAIEKLADLGVVKGDGNYAYRPGDYLTYNEAAIMLMNVLGYGLISEQNTLYAEASRVGILDGIIKEFDIVNLGDLFVMMNNSLMASPITQTGWGSTIKYEISQQTLLYKLFDIVYSDGVIIKNDITYLWTTLGNFDSAIEIETQDGSFEIDVDKMSDVRDDLGKNVRVYYYLDKNSHRNKYVYHEIDFSNKILSLDFNQLELGKTDFSKGNISYYTSDKSKCKTVSLADNYNVIYNNVAYKSKVVDIESLKYKVGNIELIDAESNGTYETIKIKAYDSLVVGNIYDYNNYITDKYKTDLKVDIDKDNYEKILVYASDKSETGLESITAGSVISVAVSDSYNGNNVLEIHISDNIRKGKITNYNMNDVCPSIVLDGQDQIPLYDRALADEKGNIISYVTNTNAIAYIDAFGNAVCVVDDETRDMQYGIIAAYAMNGNKLSSEVCVRLITASGEIIETKLSEKVVFDGSSTKAEKAYEKLSAIKTDTYGLSFASEIIPVRYKLDDDGNLKIIDTVNQSDGKNDNLKSLGGGTFVAISGNVLGYQIPFSSDATVLEISSTKLTDIDEFSKQKNVNAVVASTALKRNTKHNIIAYRSGDETPYADFIIKFNKCSLILDSEHMVIDRLAEAYNEEHEQIMYRLDGYIGGTYTQKWVDENIDINTLKSYNKGDILIVTINNDSITDYNAVLVRSESGVAYKNGSLHSTLNMNTEQSLTSMCGYVKSVKDSLVQIKNYNFSTLESVDKADWTKDILYANLDGVNITVIDDEHDVIYAGSMADILDYDSFGDKCSLIYVRIRSSVVRDVFVYNK